jgi:hypothetical protein
LRWYRGLLHLDGACGGLAAIPFPMGPTYGGLGSIESLICVVVVSKQDYCCAILYVLELACILDASLINRESVQE